MDALDDIQQNSLEWHACFRFFFNKSDKKVLEFFDISGKMQYTVYTYVHCLQK